MNKLTKEQQKKLKQQIDAAYKQWYVAVLAKCRAQEVLTAAQGALAITTVKLQYVDRKLDKLYAKLKGKKDG